MLFDVRLFAAMCSYRLHAGDHFTSSSAYACMNESSVLCIPTTLVFAASSSHAIWRMQQSRQSGCVGRVGLSVRLAPFLLVAKVPGNQSTCFLYPILYNCTSIPSDRPTCITRMYWCVGVHRDPHFLYTTVEMVEKMTVLQWF